MDEACRSISFREAHELLEREKGARFFDVREEEEYDAGHAAGAAFRLPTIRRTFSTSGTGRPSWRT